MSHKVASYRTYDTIHANMMSSPETPSLRGFIPEGDAIIYEREVADRSLFIQAEFCGPFSYSFTYSQLHPDGVNGFMVTINSSTKTLPSWGGEAVPTIEYKPYTIQFPNAIVGGKILLDGANSRIVVRSISPPNQVVITSKCATVERWDDEDGVFSPKQTLAFGDHFALLPLPDFTYEIDNIIQHAHVLLIRPSRDNGSNGSIVLEGACSGNALDVLERDTPYDFLFKTTFPLPYGAYPSKNILAVAKQFAQGDVGGVAVAEMINTLFPEYARNF